jgi:hypothetical protein
MMPPRRLGSTLTIATLTALPLLGEPYREFMRTRRRLIPFVY